MKKLLTLFFLLVVSQLALATVTKVDPPHWWIGMQDETLQLMLYGDNIGQNTVKLKRAKGVKISNIQPLKNPNYLIVELTISKRARPGQLQFTLTNSNGDAASSFVYQLLKRKANASQIKGFDTSDSIYLITPDRFANGDPANDNIKALGDFVDRDDPYGRHGGDVQGIIDNLDYIADMGFTMIWLNPILINEPKKISYHGYAVSDMYRVDPRFGGNTMYQQLSHQAKAKGLGIIMDVILNHIGTEHPWVEDLAEDNWFNIWPEYTETNHMHSTSMDPYAAPSETKVFNDGWFVPTMADLNQRNPLVAKYLVQNAIFWIESLQLAGIRVDTYAYSDNQFMADWTKAVMAEYPNFNIVGEEWMAKPSMVSYFQKGKVNHDGYTSYLPSLMDFPIALQLGPAMADKEYRWSANGLIRIYDTLAEDFVYPNPNKLVVFADNHDMDRIFTQVNQDLNMLKNALSFVLTTRGIPQIYYGTEVLIDNSDAIGSHGVIRTDFPGGWQGDVVNAFTGEGLTEDQKEIQAFVKNLQLWRQNSRAIHQGQLTHYIPVNGIYVYFRYVDDSVVMVVINKSEKDTVLAANRFQEIIKNRTKATDVISKKAFDLTKGIPLQAGTPMVLELTKD